MIVTPICFVLKCLLGNVARLESRWVRCHAVACGYIERAKTITIHCEGQSIRLKRTRCPLRAETSIALVEPEKIKTHK